MLFFFNSMIFFSAFIFILGWINQNEKVKSFNESAFFFESVKAKRNKSQDILSKYKLPQGIPLKTIGLISLFLYVVLLMSKNWKNLFWLTFIWMLVFLVLESRRISIHEAIDKEMLPFMSQLNAFLIQESNLIKAIAQIAKSPQKGYIKDSLEEFSIAIKSGLSPEIAFSHLRQTTHHSYLSYVYLNMEQAFLKQGDILTLMGELEDEYTAIQIQNEKRLVSLRQHKKMALFSIGLMIFTLYKLMTSNDFFYSYYTQAGIPVFFVISGLILGSLYLLLKGLTTSTY